MGSNVSSSFENNSTASALYAEKKREIKHSLLFSAIFLVVGLAVIIFGIAKYSSVSKQVQDSAENIDAWAWLIIAGIGAVVVVIGIIEIVKTMISYSQFGSSVNNMESHASPYQVQTLNRSVTSMNQSQALQKPAMEGMAEKNTPAGKANTNLEKGNNNKSRSSELYDKYNPTKKNVPKSEPMMQQKFDYGIHEEKKLTFADEFLMKNKADPFESYRKELGIKNEESDFYVQKPQFRRSEPLNQQPIQKPQKEEFQAQKNQPLQYEQQPPIQYQAAGKATAPQSFAKPLQQSTGSQNFSSATQAKPITQPSRQPKADADKNEELLHINFGNSSTDDSSYDFSLFEEFMPDQKSTMTASSNNETKKTANSFTVDKISETTSKKNSGRITSNSGSSAKINNGKPSIKPKVPEEVEPELAYNLDEPPKDLEEALHLPDIGIKAFSLSNEKAANKSEKKPNVQNNTEQSSSGNVKTSVNMTVSASESKAETTANSKYNFEAFTEKTPTSATTVKKSSNTNSKKGFSQSFLSRDKKEKQPLETNGKTVNGDKKTSHEICTNGTKSQRKFVDASEYDEWVCPECGKVNQEYVGICCCGKRKPHSKK